MAVSTPILTSWRLAVQEHLAGVFDGTTVRPDGDPDDLYPECEVVGGSRDGVSRREKGLIAVWWPGEGWKEWDRDQAIATPELRIRYFPSLSRQPREESPRDPAPLELAAVDLMTAMRPVQKEGDLLPGIACHIANVIPDDRSDFWYVTAAVTAFTLHLARNAA